MRHWKCLFFIERVWFLLLFSWVLEIFLMAESDMNLSNDFDWKIVLNFFFGELRNVNKTWNIFTACRNSFLPVSFLKLVKEFLRIFLKQGWRILRTTSFLINCSTFHLILFKFSSFYSPTTCHITYKQSPKALNIRNFFRIYSSSPGPIKSMLYPWITT